VSTSGPSTSPTRHYKQAAAATHRSSWDENSSTSQPHAVPAPLIRR
jgi:hypothetical protein